MTQRIRVENIDAEFEVQRDAESGAVRISMFVPRAGGIRLTAALSPEDAARIGRAMVDAGNGIAKNEGDQ